MKNSAVIKVLIGIICVLFMIAGIIWFFVYKQYQDNKKGVLQVGEVVTATPIAQQPEEMGSEIPEVAPTKEPEVAPTKEPEAAPTKEPEAVPTEKPQSNFDTNRLANPMKKAIVLTELGKKLGITKENYPRIDGSTSTFGLVRNLYWTIFEFDNTLGEFEDDMGEPKEPAKTVPSYKSLIAGDVDLIIVPDPSKEVKDLEKESGVELEYIPIGVEGLVFVTPEENPVSNITLEQINQIYVDMTITNWSQLGGADGEILALCRNRESGSQAQFDNLVVKDGKEVNKVIQDKYSISDMSSMLMAASGEDEWWVDGKPADKNWFPLGYSIYYYVQSFKEGGHHNGIKMLMYEGVEPTAETIASKEYPLAVSYYAVIRKDTAADAPARVIANWLTTDEGQEKVADAGVGKIAK